MSIDHRISVRFWLAIMFPRIWHVNFLSIGLDVSSFCNDTITLFFLFVSIESNWVVCKFLHFPQPYLVSSWFLSQNWPFRCFHYRDVLLIFWEQTGFVCIKKYLNFFKLSDSLYRLRNYIICLSETCINDILYNGMYENVTLMISLYIVFLLSIRHMNGWMNDNELAAG